MNDFSERAEKRARFHELAEYPNISTGRQFAIRQARNPNPTDHHRRATAQTISLLRCANPDMVSRGRNPGGWQTNYSSPALDQCLLPHRAIRLPRRGQSTGSLLMAAD